MITNNLWEDFFFKNTFKDPEIAKPVIEGILGESIGEITKEIDIQHTLKIAVDNKEIAFDVLIEDDMDNIFDLEMENQSKRKAYLETRSLYYLSMLIATQLTDKGEGKEYENVKNSYIIFLCNFDLYKEGKYTYQWELKRNDNNLKA